MSALTEKQAAAWPTAVERLNARGASVPSSIAQWDVAYSEETRPGRGHFVNATFIDGEVFAQILMDVYGYPTAAFAQLNWVHADDDEECDCAPCVAAREADEVSA